ncbi:MBL fold metallo-hydrolase [Nocardioides bizhenqiangii]|uniref:MBL fold metallo-hydrolase n=1 Tax=Nocardioides bizhenqiangii TaxID=3095076 RepID=A0ABZ0ZRC6_9ACTN|nr:MULTISPECIES: MBL fold metallo-hydrolase [unclassified Nocardioides]MDZ5622538.1 MBL fold metallo-hydrolase [Nocardioides sp. HM23]WQQ26793.1 MBL fold metallo-hydrolase [Nocardioides sp. HM61]
MRLPVHPRAPLGRPRLEPYADRFDVPAAEGPMSVQFLGVATLLVDDGETQLLTDGFFSRPGLLSVGLRRVEPDRRRIEECLTRAGATRVRAVAPVHSHYDHALDSAVVADLTGARLVGGESTANIGRGGDLPDDRIRVVDSGDEVQQGAFSLTFIASEHCPPDRFPGAITEPVVPPAKVGAYKCGEAWSILVEHASSHRLLIQGSAGYVEGALTGLRAEVAYLGVGQLGKQDETYIRAYWEHTVRAIGARRVVLIHWDDFFRPLDRPLRALPYFGDDLDATMRVLLPLAEEDGVSLHFPTVWAREDPWVGL